MQLLVWGWSSSWYWSLQFGICDFYISAFWLEIAIFGLGHISVTHRRNPQKQFLIRKHVVWAIKCENRFSGSTWARSREKRTGQDSQKKSQSGNNWPLWGEAPTVPIETKIGMMCSLGDIITCAKFQGEIFMGYDFTGEGSNFPFSYWFSHRPYNSAALQIGTKLISIDQYYDKTVALCLALQLRTRPW